MQNYYKKVYLYTSYNKRTLGKDNPDPFSIGISQNSHQKEQNLEMTI